MKRALEWFGGKRGIAIAFFICTGFALIAAGSCIIVFASVLRRLSSITFIGLALVIICLSLALVMLRLKKAATVASALALVMSLISIVVSNIDDVFTTDDNVFKLIIIITPLLLVFGIICLNYRKTENAIEGAMIWAVASLILTIIAIIISDPFLTVAMFFVQDWGTNRETSIGYAYCYLSLISAPLYSGAALIFLCLPVTLPRTCPKCGKRNIQKAKFCVGCGESLNLK